jgi:hypothetical protein
VLHFVYNCTIRENLTPYLHFTIGGVSPVLLHEFVLWLEILFNVLIINYFCYQCYTVIITLFNMSYGRLSGERWNHFSHCEGAHQDKVFVEIVLDRTSISLFQLPCLKSMFGYSSRDFLFYKMRRGIDGATVRTILPIANYTINDLLMVISHVVSYAEEGTNGVHTHPEDENHEATSHQWSRHLMLGFPRRKERVT